MSAPTKLGGRVGKESGRKGKGNLQLSQPWTHRSFGVVRGKIVVRWQTSDDQLRVGGQGGKDILL